MSLELLKRVDQSEPQNLKTNIGATCFRYLQLSVKALREAGNQAEFVCKTAGDQGKYVPPGFGQHQVRGSDGQFYTIVGVSHDALYINGKQHDCIVSGNYQPTNPNGYIAAPAFSEIPHHEWRPGNPPLPSNLEMPISPPAPPLPAPGTPPSTQPNPCRVPSYGELGDAAFFVNKIGVPLDADMRTNNEVMNAGSADWIGRAVHGMIESFMKYGDHREADKIAKKVQNEWRAVMNNPQLPQIP